VSEQETRQESFLPQSQETAQESFRPRRQKTVQEFLLPQGGETAANSACGIFAAAKISGGCEPGSGGLAFR
jgi:hypothetical protein